MSNLRQNTLPPFPNPCPLFWCSGPHKFRTILTNQSMPHSGWSAFSIESGHSRAAAPPCFVFRMNNLWLIDRTDGLGSRTSICSALCIALPFPKTIPTSKPNQPTHPRGCEQRNPICIGNQSCQDLYFRIARSYPPEQASRINIRATRNEMEPVKMNPTLHRTGPLQHFQGSCAAASNEWFIQQIPHSCFHFI